MTAWNRWLAALVAICTVSTVGSADPWKDESGHGRGRDRDWQAWDNDRQERCRGRGCEGQWYGGPGIYIDPSDALELVRCNRDIVGGVIGGAGGAVLGSRIGDGDLRAATTIGGAILGALIGGIIGREIDLRDQACIGYALEYADSNERVRWRGPDGVRYEVRPGERYRRDDGMDCRSYEAFADDGNRLWSTMELACRRRDGAWVAG